MCPHCHEPMITLEMDGIEVDRCALCNGTWLDAGELESIGRVQGGWVERMVEVLSGGGGVSPSPRKCPRCSWKLKAVAVEADDGLRLDRCRWGHGIWCDAGEVEALVRLMTPQETESQPVRILAALNAGPQVRSGEGD